jgi:hypothetical protein
LETSIEKESFNRIGLYPAPNSRGSFKQEDFSTIPV